MDTDTLGHLYQAHDRTTATHLALSWKGRVRFTVPREEAAQEQCWKLFKPGRLEFPMRAMSTLPRLFGAVSCVESENFTLIREAVGDEAGFSSCRAGALGPWYKDTVLLLDNAAQPLFIVKVGAGEAVNGLLTNEANWLKTLSDEPSLAKHIPELVAHRSDLDLSLVAQRVLAGSIDFSLGPLQLDFLCKLQECSQQTVRYQDSGLFKTLQARLDGLSGLLPEEWSHRLETSMKRIEQSFSDGPIQVVAAHNDFTPWNIRLDRGAARVFDWEYAADERLPLFDPLHFVLAPLALKSTARAKIIREIQETVEQCRQSLGKDRCYKPKTQALAYMINLCTLYLWADRGTHNDHPSLVSYARVIDSGAYSQGG
jgi:hypothetical protein